MQSNTTSTSRRAFMRRSAALLAGAAATPVLQAAADSGVTRINDHMLVVDAGCNVLVDVTSDGLVLVDSGVPAAAAKLQAEIAGLGRVSTLINTHWHDDQCGNNKLFAEQGASIIAHKKTRLYLETERYLPREERYFTAYPQQALPTETFYETAGKHIGGQSLELGHLLLAHTNSDIYVHFTQDNVLAVGDAVSPLRDPELDWFSGAWIGGRAEALDKLLALSDEQTRIVPSYGPVIGKAELQTERDMMWQIYEITVELVRKGYTPQHMLEDGFMAGLPRSFDDPYKFLYDLCKGLWGHHNKLSPNVV